MEKQRAAPPLGGQVGVETKLLNSGDQTDILIADRQWISGTSCFDLAGSLQVATERRSLPGNFASGMN
jgi:hypothetical protein